MNKWGLLNLALGGCLGLLVLLLAAMHTNPNKRNPYWLQGMVVSPAAGDFSGNPYFANGQTLQTPPDGTLPQGEKPYPFTQGGVEAAMAAGKTIHSPLTNPEDPLILERGKIMFERNCMPCHGVAGRGDGVVPQHGFPSPPSLLAEHAKGLPDGYIYNYITNGGILMPAYGAQIDPRDRWKVIAWVRHMQKTFPEQAPAAGTPQADLEAQIIPSTTPGYGYSGPPPYDQTVADEALIQAQIDNRENPSPAEATEVPTPAAASAFPDTPWGKAQAMIAKDQLDCFSCHAVDHKVVGPAYIDVAKRYAGKPGIVATLVAKVKNGGAGNWGAIPMAAHPNTPNADLQVIVEGILSLGTKGAASAASAPAKAASAPAASGAASAATSASAAPANPWADAQAVIAKDQLDCLACHAVDHKVVGPAYIDVAKRYAGKPGVVAVLVAKIKNGGSGNWGAIPMSAHPTAPVADLTRIVKDILALKGKQAFAPSLKKVMQIVHSGRPFHCPALGDEAVNGPAYLDEGGGASVRRIPSGEDLASLDMGSGAGSVAKETK